MADGIDIAALQAWLVGNVPGYAGRPALTVNPYGKGQA